MTGLIGRIRPKLEAQLSDPSGGPFPRRAWRYLIELSRDPSFAQVEARATAYEPASSLVPDHDLSYGTDYYWRAQVTDESRGVTSPWSDTQRFRTIERTLDDQWSLVVVQTCQSGEAFTYDGRVEPRDGGLRFTASTKYGGYGGSLVMDLDQRAEAVTGTLIGEAAEQQVSFVGRFSRAARSSQPAIVTGRAAADGSFAGTFDGFMQWVLISSASTDVACSSNAIEWRLLPPR